MNTLLLCILSFSIANNFAIGFYCICLETLWGVSSVPFPFQFPFQLHCKLVSSLQGLDATELVYQPLTQTAVEMINIHVILVLQKRLVQ